jgi:nucleoside-diphosphate-sugar epimerase
MSPTRDFTFVSDTVEGLIKAGECEQVVGEEINLGTGLEISIEGLAKKIAVMVGCDVSVRQDEERRRPAKSEVQRLLSDNTKARKLLGWQPQKGLDEGLLQTVEWVKGRLAMYDPDSYRI